MNITAATLLSICYQKHLHATRAEKIAGLLMSICPQYGIDTADIMHEFLANLLHECFEFTRYEEGLNYKAEALIKNFGRHRITEAQAWMYGRTTTQQANQKMIANTIYGGEWGKKNLGNTFPNDGFDFRGSGAIQLTGRKNITDFALWMEKKFALKKTPEQWAEALRTSDEYSMHSACWIFAIGKKLIQAAIDDQMQTIVLRINGGLNGIDERMKYYDLCKKYIV